MRRFLTTIALCAWTIGGEAATPVRSPLPAPMVPLVRSRTGQFVVTALPTPSTRPPVASAGAGEGLADLDPATLVLTCERVRNALGWELGLPDWWAGRVYVVINPALTNNHPALVGAAWFGQGWQYRLEVPPRMEPPRLVRGLVQVLLLELANRRAGPRSAEIPLWLSEGLSLHLIHSSLVELVLGRPQETINRVGVLSVFRERVRPDPLAQARDRLQSHAALSLGRLGEITGEGVSEETWRTFQACAQLLVQQLTQIPGGRALLTEMIQQLPAYLNWQTAFLTTFRPLFPRMLDAEKWWSVILVHFTGLDPLNAWSLEIALEKLDSTLHPPVLVSFDRRSLPRRQTLSLQQILREWDYLRQRMVLKGVSTQLATLRWKFPPEVVGLADAYREALEQYFSRRDRPTHTSGLPDRPPFTPQGLVRQTVEKLDQLDQRRQALRPAPTPNAAAVAPR